MRTCKRCGGKTVAGLDPKKDEHFNPYVCITNLDNRIKDLAADARSLADEVEKLRAEISERDASSAQLDAGGGWQPATEPPAAHDEPLFQLPAVDPA